MKIWYGYGSEHSANLVVIGQFKDVQDAAKAKQVIDWLTEQVRRDIDAGLLTIGEPTDHYSDEMLELLRRVDFHSVGPGEVEQFTYDIKVELEKNRVVVTTDEIDVSAFLKVLLSEGARVEVYSAHDYPGTSYGRGSKVAKAEA